MITSVLACALENLRVISESGYVLLYMTVVQLAVLFLLRCLCLEAFMATEFKCTQSDSCVQMWRFPDVSGTQSVPISDCIPIFTFKISTEPVSESLHILTGLSAQEHFIELRCFTVWNANAPSAANTVAFDLLPEAVKGLVILPNSFHLSTAFQVDSRDLGHPCLARTVDKVHKPGHFWTIKKIRRYNSEAWTCPGWPGHMVTLGFDGIVWNCTHENTRTL